MVYGPVDHSRLAEFLRELHGKILAASCPIVIGGDFNLLRGPMDNSNLRVNNPRLAEMFNDWVADLELIELHRNGAKFTWTNNQDDPVRCVLDRVFVSMDWENHFLRCSLSAEIRLGSDHCPLMLSSGEEPRRASKCYFFEKQWLLQSGFRERVAEIWARAEAHPPHRYGPLCDVLDEWQNCIRRLRHHLRGWGANVGSDLKTRKQALLAEIVALDNRADSLGLSHDKWAR